MRYKQDDQVDFRGKSRKDLTGRGCWPGQPFIPEDVSSETSLQKSRTQMIFSASPRIERVDHEAPLQARG